MVIFSSLLVLVWAVYRRIHHFKKGTPVSVMSVAAQWCALFWIALLTVVWIFSGIWF